VSASCLSDLSRFKPGAFHACAIGVEDAAVLAKIFSHLLREDQIPTFLYAFQDLRQKRLAMFKRNDMNNITYMNLPTCELQKQRDHDMRMNELEGKNALEMGQSMEFWEELKDIFTYDCEDEADNWYVAHDVSALYLTCGRLLLLGG
jgi:salicylate hydroxylase